MSLSGMDALLGQDDASDENEFRDWPFAARTRSAANAAAASNAPTRQHGRKRTATYLSSESAVVGSTRAGGRSTDTTSPPSTRSRRPQHSPLPRSPPPLRSPPPASSRAGPSPYSRRPLRSPAQVYGRPSLRSASRPSTARRPITLDSSSDDDVFANDVSRLRTPTPRPPEAANLYSFSPSPSPPRGGLRPVLRRLADVSTDSLVERATATLSRPASRAALTFDGNDDDQAPVPMEEDAEEAAGGVGDVTLAAIAQLEADEEIARRLQRELNEAPSPPRHGSAPTAARATTTGTRSSGGRTTLRVTEGLRTASTATGTERLRRSGSRRRPARRNADDSLAAFIVDDDSGDSDAEDSPWRPRLAQAYGAGDWAMPFRLRAASARPAPPSPTSEELEEEERALLASLGLRTATLGQRRSSARLRRLPLSPPATRRRQPQVAVSLRGGGGGRGGGRGREDEAYEDLLELTEAMGQAGGLRKAQIDQLPTVTHSLSAQGGEAESCTVCMSELEAGEELTVLPCAHRFHRPCVAQWLKQRNSCPVCRSQAVPPNAGRRERLGQRNHYLYSP